MKTYLPRLADDILRLKLSAMGAVLVEGAKWCGKTTTCERQAASALYLADPLRRAQAVRMAELDPARLLSGDAPRLLDEWQVAPQLWDAVRHRVDHADGEGLFLLTGSAVPADVSKIVHSGTGRIGRVKMRPMSLWESGESSGEVSLSALFSDAGFSVAGAKPLSLEAAAFLACRGGWPKSVGKTGAKGLVTAREYVEGVAESDLSRVDGTPRDPDRVRRLMRSCARLQGTQASLSALRRDMAANDVLALDENTIASYVSALKRIFVIDDLPAWCPNLRAKGAIRTTDTRYFVDPSLAAAAMGIGPGNLMDDLSTFGFFFETMAVRDLRAYAEALGGRVEKYHDKHGLECDAVVHLPDGRYGLVEIKLGGETLVNEGAATLVALAGVIAGAKMRPPSFRMVLVAVGDFAYRRKEDGVLVCPLSALKN